MANRRNRERYPLQFQAELRARNGKAAAAVTGQTRDISGEGFYFEGDAESFQEGNQVELAVWLPEAQEGKQAKVRGRGHVVRVDRESKRKRGVAVCFDDVVLTAGGFESIT